MKIFKVVCAAALAFTLATAGAIAQVAAPAVEPGNIVDFGPVINTVLTGAVGLAAAGLSWLFGEGIRFLRSKTKLANAIDAESAQRRFNEAAKRSLSYAASRAKQAVGEGKVKIDSTFIRTAAEYFLEFWPELVKGLDLEQIGKTLTARLDNGEMSVAADAVAANNSTSAAPVVPGLATTVVAAVTPAKK